LSKFRKEKKEDRSGLHDLERVNAIALFHQGGGEKKTVSPLLNWRFGRQREERKAPFHIW